MSQVIFKYPDQVFVGLATRNADGSLKHEAFLLVNAVPKKGDALLNRRVADVITHDEKLLKTMARRGEVDEMAAIVILERTT